MTNRKKQNNRINLYTKCQLCPRGKGRTGFKLRRNMRQHIIEFHDMDYDKYIYMVNHDLFNPNHQPVELTPKEDIIFIGNIENPPWIDDWGD